MNPELRGYLEKIFLRQKNDYRYDWKEDAAAQQGPFTARIEDELAGWGPLRALLEDESITEILVNGPRHIFCERQGTLEPCTDYFFSAETYRSTLDRIAQSCGTYLSREKPFLECQHKNLRITMIYPEIARGQTLLSIRISRGLSWTLDELRRHRWCNDVQLNQLRDIFRRRENFLVAGGTSSGKTSLLQALLQEMRPRERAVVIEDTQELFLPDPCGVSLLTRRDPAASVSDVNMDDLLRRALRLRPDRIVVGEIRGGEARSLLLALSAGHSGSFGSLHAHTAPGALLRLEMLIQMGAPQWSLPSIRRLMAMTLQYILLVEKNDRERRLGGIYRVGAVEERGLLLTRTDADEDI